MNADPVTVEATSRTDRSREIVLFLKMPARLLTHFASSLPVSPGLECTRFNLVQWYINKTKSFSRDKAHVFRACVDSFMCPVFEEMMLPISRCGVSTKKIQNYC